ncbi:MAG: hypothetical protein KDA45_11915 [Planctomycetales bacterium]|nr:hypothetical protein [Planctomycetales bacterium]
MNSRRTLFALLALVIASVGPMPLWLHHLASHSAAHHALSSSMAADVHGCCHGHHCHGAPSASQDGQESAPQPPAWTTPAHDCFVCFQLAQTSWAVCTAPDVTRGRMPPEFSLVSEFLFVPTVGCPAPPRGPPAA